ncbi:MAG: hypothetical protein LC800_22875 [Acidobacteria bacterium]|nr:hypothetical protein [Acidobacteriota bacterium]
MDGGEILKALEAPGNKGELLELVLVDALEDLGFKNVRKQLSGSQYGFDVSAHRVSRTDGRLEVWKFECKNLNRPVTVGDIAPKLLWHDGSVTLDRFVIVGVSQLSNDLDHLLRHHRLPMPISVWTEGDLADLFAASPRAMARLGLRHDPDQGLPPPDFEQFNYYPAQPISLDVVHRHDPPHAFDYVRIGDEVLKAYTSTELRLLACVTNPMKAAFPIHSLRVTTQGYESVSGRVLRLVKPKGFVEPVKITFRPSHSVGSGVELLDDKVWTIGPNAVEHATLLLDRATAPGLYQVAFEISGRKDGETVARLSPTFVFHVEEPGLDLLTLHVVGRHYDSPVGQLLHLPRQEWRRLKREAGAANRRVFLGPSDHEIINQKTDHTWIIRAVRTKPGRVEHSEAWSASEPPKVLLDLGTPVDEELYSARAALGRVTGKDGWQDLLPRQLDRRRSR